MIDNYFGTIFEGSPNLETSVAEQEINTSGKRLLNFTIIVDGDCHLSINSGEYVFVRSGFVQLFDVVNSAKIQESGITFSWTAVKG